MILLRENDELINGVFDFGFTGNIMGISYGI
jgi:hypothetical protein